MTVAGLQAIDSGFKLDALHAAKQTAIDYCISATVGGTSRYEGGPADDLCTTPC